MPTEFNVFLFATMAVMAVTSTGHSREPEGGVPLAKPRVFESIPDAHYDMGGEVGRRLEAVTEQWIIPAPEANPQMLEMFRTQNRTPIVETFDGFIRPFPWIGEYAGKYLTHAVQTYKLTRDTELLDHLTRFVGELVSLQAEDGYLGPWPEEMRFKPGPWDTWGHYHIMTGLLMWYEQTHDDNALGCAEKIGDLLCNTFLNTDKRILDTGSHEMNMAPVHSLCLLYEITGTKRYLDLALEIEKEFTEAGDYVRAGLDGREFFQTPRPRWESLHSIMGIAQLYQITGDDKYRTAFENLWWSMAKCDRHNNGGFSSQEAARGDPYRPGAIETCCTVAWMALSVDMLRLTGNPLVVDELELSMMNSGIGMMSPTGQWVTYDTPMDGIRYPSLQCGDAGGSRLNCCSVNGPRTIAMTCEWALMRNSEGLVLNYYGPCTMTAATATGNKVSLLQNTDYPIGNKVELTTKPEKSEEFTLAIRIPKWSVNTSVKVNGETVDAKAGTYLKLKRTWKDGDRVVIELDFRPHFWVNKPAYKVEHFNAQWSLFGPMESLNEKQRGELEKQVTSATDAIPATLSYTVEETGEDGATTTSTKTVTPKKLDPKDGHIDLLKDLDSRDMDHFLYAFVRFDSPAEQKARFVYGTSGDPGLYVNGQPTPAVPAGDTLRYGRYLVAEIPLRKGANIIALKVPKQRFVDMFWVWNVKWHMSTGWETLDPGVMVTSIYRGPILLTYDPRYNTIGFDDLPVLEAAELTPVIASCDIAPKPWLLCDLSAPGGKTVRVCDFAGAGSTGTFYRSWLRVRFDGETNNDFTRENPLRSFRP